MKYHYRTWSIRWVQSCADCNIIDIIASMQKFQEKSFVINQRRSKRVLCGKNHVNYIWDSWTMLFWMMRQKWLCCIQKSINVSKINVYKMKCHYRTWSRICVQFCANCNIFVGMRKFHWKTVIYQSETVKNNIVE